MSELKKHLCELLISNGLPVSNKHISILLSRHRVKTFEEFNNEFSSFRDFVVALFKCREKDEGPYTAGYFADIAIRKYLESN